MRQANLMFHDDDEEFSSDEVEWTEEEIGTLHEGILRESIHALFDTRSSQDAIKDVDSWMAEDNNRPFSYRNCCAIIGVDPDELRDAVRCQWRKLRRGMLKHEQSQKQSGPQSELFAVPA